MKLRKPCEHGFYDEHRLEGVAPWAEDLVNWPHCPGGVFLPDDALVVNRDDAELVAEYLDNACRFDHHGYCQNHALTEAVESGVCGIGRFVRSVLDALSVREAE